METRKTQTVSFLKQLPLEIRMKIYRNLLSTKYTRHHCTDRQGPTDAKLWPGHAYGLDPSILRTCRQIHSEASTVLYDENLLVRIRSNIEHLRHLTEPRGIPAFLEGRKAETFKHCALYVDFDYQYNAIAIKRMQEDKPCYVIATDDLLTLCQSFLYRYVCMSPSPERYKVRVTVHRTFDDVLSNNPAPSSPQYRLLQPFTVLHSIPQFKIDGFANEEYCARIAASASRIAPAVEECLGKVIELRDKGHVFVARKHLRGAIKAYRTAYIQLRYHCCARTIWRPTWSDIYPDQHYTIIDMQVSLVASLAFSHYTLEEYEDAHFWADAATKGGPISLTLQCETIFAKLVYRQAMASARLGNTLQGVDEVLHGLKLVTQKVYQDKELVWMRREALRHLTGISGNVNLQLRMAMGFDIGVRQAEVATVVDSQ